MKISAVIPVYNSSKILYDSYKNIKKQLSKVTRDYEILFRNDGSRDESEEVLKKIAGKDKRVRIFSNPGNKGLGFTLRNLFKDAKGNLVIYFDADAYLCFNLDMLPKFLKIIQDGADVVIASRYEKPGRNIPFYRVYPSRIYYAINKILFNINIEDVGSGFVVFKKKALDKIKLASDGFDIHIEIFSKIKRAGFKIKEVPVTYKHWYGGSFDVLKHGPKTLFRTLKVWYNLTILRK